MAWSNGEIKDFLIPFGIMCDICERTVHKSYIKKDLFGIFDLVGVSRSHNGTLGIQHTSKTNVSSRIAKIKEAEITQQWLLSGNHIWVLGWQSGNKRFMQCSSLILLPDMEIEVKTESFYETISPKA